MYFEHYETLNDLSDQGRMLRWPDYHACFSSILPKDTMVRILDVGCGAGLFLEWLSSLGYSNVQGIDADEGQVKFAQQLKLNVQCIADSATWIKSAGLFDLIVMLDVIEHIPTGQDSLTLKAIHDSLADRGWFVLRTPNANASFAPRFLYGDPTHQRAYTEDSLGYYLRMAGFTQIRITSGDVYRIRSLPGALRLFTRLTFHFFRRLEAVSEFGPLGFKMPLSLNLLAICRK